MTTEVDEEREEETRTRNFRVQNSSPFAVRLQRIAFLPETQVCDEFSVRIMSGDKGDNTTPTLLPVRKRRSHPTPSLYIILNSHFSRLAL